MEVTIWLKRIDVYVTWNLSHPARLEGIKDAIKHGEFGPAEIVSVKVKERAA